MRNRRVFQRTSCAIPVVVHAAGKFLYGELVDMSLGGSRLIGKDELPTDRLELTPHRTHLDRASIIPLPYKVCWQEGDEEGGAAAGLQFAGGIDAFFRGWLADHLQQALPSQEMLLDARQVVRIPCQLDGILLRENGEMMVCAVLDLSAGGVSVATTDELFPGESFRLSLPGHPELGQPEVIVLRTQPFTGHHLCGARFLELVDEQVACLERLVPTLARITLSDEESV